MRNWLEHLRLEFCTYKLAYFNIGLEIAPWSCWDEMGCGVVFYLAFWGIDIDLVIIRGP